MKNNHRRRLNLIEFDDHDIDKHIDNMGDFSEPPEFNVIYFSEEITPTSVERLSKHIDSCTKKILKQKIALDIDVEIPIKLYMNSPGGDVYSGFALHDKIRTSKLPIHFYIEGVCASAATLPMVAATKSFMSKNSFVMIHQISSQTWGTYESVKTEVKNLDLMMGKLYDIYTTYTNLKREEVVEILKKDELFDAETSLKYGLIKEIY